MRGKTRDLLIVIDMQNDFIGGALGTAEARAVVDRVAELIRSTPARNVIATRDTHSGDYLSTAEGRKLPVIHCVKGTPGWQLNPVIAAALGSAPVIDKPTFGSTELARRLAAVAEREPVSLTLAGLCTDICVISNALLFKAFMPEVPIRVLAGCCAGVTPQSHETALAAMEACQIDVVRGPAGPAV